MLENRNISPVNSVRLEDIFQELPSHPPFIDGIRRAPKRKFTLSRADTELALKNALRYIPEKWHSAVAPEFLEELFSTGRIYGYRFRPEGAIVVALAAALDFKLRQEDRFRTATGFGNAFA